MHNERRQDVAQRPVQQFARLEYFQRRERAVQVLLNQLLVFAVNVLVLDALAQVEQVGVQRRVVLVDVPDQLEPHHSPQVVRDPLENCVSERLAGPLVFLN